MRGGLKMVVAGAAPKIIVDARKCSGCRMCEQICSFYHEREFNPRKARIKVLIREKKGIYAPLFCIQCKKCLPACKRNALSWDQQVGVIRVDLNRCNGCGLCIPVCEQAAIILDPTTKKVNICDLCDGEPQCVKWCQQEALTFKIP